MNLIEPIPEQLMNKDIPPSLSISITLFIGAVLAGYYCVDLLKRWKETDTQINEIQTKVQDTESMLEAQADTIHELDQRIREKKDYDDSEEIQEGKYQAWKGFYHENYRKCEIKIWREKLSSLKKNQEWTAWTGEKDSSITVRDFYLGNLHPEFQWTLDEGDTYFIANVSDTFVNTWDSVIKIVICQTFGSKEDVLQFTEQEYYNGNLTLNLALKKYIEIGSIQWSRVLIDSTS